MPAGQGLTDNGLGMFNIGPPSYVRGGFGEFRSMLRPSLLSQAIASTGLPGGGDVPHVHWSSRTSAMGELSAGSRGDTHRVRGRIRRLTPFADASPTVSLFERSYQPPRSWRGNLSYASTIRSLLYSVEGIVTVSI